VVRLAAMRTLEELDFPPWDYSDETSTGPRFHREVQELRERSWLARVHARDLKRGTPSGILSDAGISLEEFRKLL
jgi:hypothetical protein